MLVGLTVANIGDVPAATWVGQQIGWRTAFACIAALGVLAIVSIRLALPDAAPGRAPDVRHELRVLTKSSVLLAMATTVLGSSAMFTLITIGRPRASP